MKVVAAAVVVTTFLAEISSGIFQKGRLERLNK